MGNLASVHGTCSARAVYKLDAEGQSTSITTTTTTGFVEEAVEQRARYVYRLGDSARNGVKAQHYILLLLWRLGPLTSNEILSYLHEAEYNVKDLRDLHSRIYYLRRSKLVIRDEDGKYRLTENGEKYAEELARQYLVFAKGSEKIRKILATIGIFSSIEDVLKTYRRYIENKLSKILDEISEIFRLDKDEIVVIEYLLKHLENSILTGRRSRSAYTYASIMMKDLGFDPAYFKELIGRLQSKGLVYVYGQKHSGMSARIGLKPEFAQRLWSELESGSSIYAKPITRVELFKSARTSQVVGVTRNG